MNIGYAVCGSFCTHAHVLPMMERLQREGNEIFPILSETSYQTSTRFGEAEAFREKIEALCGREIIHTIPQAEVIGPKKLLDILVIAPCTGNTLGKIANGITDTCVTMAAKAHIRNDRPVLLAVATNDALGGSAPNIGRLFNYKNIYFVPMRQDDPVKKPKSMIALFDCIPEAIEAAMQGKQVQPVYR